MMLITDENISTDTSTTGHMEFEESLSFGSTLGSSFEDEQALDKNDSDESDADLFLGLWGL